MSVNTLGSMSPIDSMSLRLWLEDPALASRMMTHSSLVLPALTIPASDPLNPSSNCPSDVAQPITPTLSPLSRLCTHHSNYLHMARRTGAATFEGKLLASSSGLALNAPRSVLVPLGLSSQSHDSC
ncbi:hypothetical protein Hypma_003711 [Hypsizygus marmoreus]|uniref:Uncharacterized protein n=1 Tax=Hypsizygus marmoreus TaxID=39966 RepID=A0A369J5H0_HYPMA|nr:hypothetical protein Hypma_003711 [Hypsizygus marmoreus]